MPPYNTPYYSAIQRRRAWRASANDPSMPEHWADFVGGGNEGFLEDFDPTAAISGGLALAGQYASMANQGLGLQPAPEMQRSATGQPIYSAGGAYNEAISARPQGATGGEILSGAGQGAAAGASLGPIGAVVGGAIGAGTVAIGGGRRGRRQRLEKERALDQLGGQQQEFNKASQVFNERQIALDEYHRRLSGNDQLYNLYR